MKRGLSKIEKVPRGIQGEKSSKDMTSSRNLVSTFGTGTHKMGDGINKSLTFVDETVSLIKR